MARAMESRALLVDVSVAMGDDLAIAKRALLAMAQQKMIQVPPLQRCVCATTRRHSLRAMPPRVTEAPQRPSPACVDPITRRALSGAAAVERARGACGGSHRAAISRLCSPAPVPLEQMPTKSRMGLVMMGSTGVRAAAVRRRSFSPAAHRRFALVCVACVKAAR